MEPIISQYHFNLPYTLRQFPYDLYTTSSRHSEEVVCKLSFITKNLFFSVTIEKEVYFLEESVPFTVHCPDDGKYSPDFEYKKYRNGIIVSAVRYFKEYQRRPTVNNAHTGIHPEMVQQSNN